jgi:hypothetical protein
MAVQKFRLDAEDIFRLVGIMETRWIGLMESTLKFDEVFGGQVCSA